MISPPLCRGGACFALTLLFTALAFGSDSQLEPVAHPNHFVLLIDDSASAVKPTQPKRDIFHEVLLDKLIPRLYDQGFGDIIPHFVPSEDLLTVQQFGMVDPPYQDAYLRLADQDLPGDFLRQVILRQRGIERQELAAKIVPQNSYQYTVLSWAKQLALAAIGAGDETAHRNFLIFVHDGQPNAHGTREEDRAVKRYLNEASRELAKAQIEEIETSYLFSNGDGGDDAAWRLSEEAQHREYPIFMEVFEVVSKADQAWQQRANGFEALRDLRFRWIEDSGARPHGVLEGTLDDGFRRWLAEAEVLSSSLRVRDSAGSFGEGLAEPDFKVQVSSRGRLSCEPRDLAVVAEFVLSRRDPLLGTRSLVFPAAASVRAPIPGACNLEHRLKRSGQAAFLLLLLGLLAGYFHCRFFRRAMRVRLPGHIDPISLERTGARNVVTPVPPKAGREAFRLLLPGLWYQRIFHRGAVLTLITPQGSVVHWSKGRRDETELLLPGAGKEVGAYWHDVPAEPIKLRLVFRHGNRSSELIVGYPRKGG